MVKDAAYYLALREILQAKKMNSAQLRLSNLGLTEVPPEIGNLTRLQELNLTRNRLSSLPSEIGNLTCLQKLNLARNQLSSIPPEIGNLSNLTILYLDYNSLRKLPPEIGSLSDLRGLYLQNNDLTDLPLEIGNLSNLLILDLNTNSLDNLPSEIGKLRVLREIDLKRTRLSSLPPEMSKLINLEVLYLDDNPFLVSPPKSIIQDGIQAIRSYLHDILKSRAQIWRSKMLVVGEGAVGKTSAIKLLCNENFDPKEDKTHSMQIREIELPHPQRTVTMYLKTWDFGGQDIYHATHQFFYSNRSLFLVVWNARKGYEQGKVDEWLDRIHSLAPESPILIVATHIDQHPPDIPLQDFQRQYPQIVGMVEISNATGNGILSLKEKIQSIAADLPLMGELWPKSWRDFADVIVQNDYISTEPDTLIEHAKEYGIGEFEARVLLNWLHSLGDILYFDTNPELDNVIILQPEWVSKRIGDALVAREVIAGDGVFTYEDMKLVWGGESDFLRNVLLNLMEQFDLSYKIPDDPENRSLIVERLNHQPPDYQSQWDGVAGQNELTMRFRMPDSNMPPGIPTWFIARSHRFTTKTHWRTGALFRDRSLKNYALVRAFPQQRYVDLTVRGPVPHNFLTLMRDGLDVTFDRFEGLDVRRVVPCPGHNGESCSHEFDLRTVEKALERNREKIECPATLEEVLVSQLAFGVKLAGKKQEQLDRIEMIVSNTYQSSNDKLDALIEYVQREFTTVFRAMQSNVDTTCPNIVTISPIDAQQWYERFLGQQMRLQLYCQAPGEWHPPIDDDGNYTGYYTIPNPAEWLLSIENYLKRLVKVLKFASPVIGSWLNSLDAETYLKEFEFQVSLTESLTSKLESIDFEENLADLKALGIGRKLQMKGSDLRALRHLLEELDPSKHWGGLRRVLTPEGHYLWLCEHHAKSYLEWVG